MFAITKWNLLGIILVGCALIESVVGGKRNPSNSTGCYKPLLVYDVDYVYFDSSLGSTYSGFYFRDANIYNGSESVCQCDTSKYYYGTYLYTRTVDGTTYYLHEVKAGTYTQIWLATAPCDSGAAIGLGTISSPFFYFYTSHWWTQGQLNGLVSWKDSSLQTVTITSFCDNAYGYPSSCTTDAPTNLPTETPIRQPSQSPTAPTDSPTFRPSNIPTEPTLIPTNAPSNAPTPRPTHLPTVNVSNVKAVNCSGLEVLYLTNAFPDDEADPNFYIEDFYYNEHNVWSNNFGVSIYWSDRWDDNGRWIINNGSYTLMRDDVDYFADAVPGSGYVAYDHFPNNNIEAASYQQYTLKFTCYETVFPTALPTEKPTLGTPSAMPTYNPVAPTNSPTVACKGLQISIDDINCESTLGYTSYTSFASKYAQQSTKYNNKYWWRGVAKGRGDYVIYYNEVYDKWVIDSPDTNGYALVEEDDDNSYNGVYPKNYGLYMVVKSDDTYYPGCYLNVSYTCKASSYPTFAPTAASVDTATTQSPTDMPSAKPTGSPSQPPTIAPSDSPTIGPTSAPTSVCFGMVLYGAFNETSGQYNQGDDTINDRNWWYNINSDAILFYSSAVIHETWALYSASRSEYYLSQSTPPDQPATGDWDFYIGASPFVDSTVTLTLDCQDNAFTTPVPSPAPSTMPTDMPIVTLSPSSPPVDCSFAYVSTNSSEYDFFNGDYSQDEVASGDKTLSWTNRNNEDLVIYHDGSYWFLTNASDESMEDTLVIDDDEYKPPDSGSWQEYDILVIPETTMDNVSSNYSDMPYQTEIVGDNIFVNFDCATSIDPTSMPSSEPTLLPSAAPTSACKSLVLATDDDFEYQGAYTKQNYELNGHLWWKSDYLGAMIAFDSGSNYWHVSSEDNQNLLLVEQVTLLTVDDEYWPPSGSYYYAYTQDSVTVTIECYDTQVPTSQPSGSPTGEPTMNHAPEWESCANDTNFMDFIESGSSSYSVYWTEPVATDTGDINLTSDSYNVGDELPFGKNVITYTATDSEGLSATCSITVYVLGGADANSYDTCLDNNFVVSVTVNDTYYVLDSGSISVGSFIDVDGKVSSSELNDDNQNCYVHLTIVSSYSDALETNSEDSSAISVLNSFDYWAIVTCVLLLWLCILSIIVVRCICLRKKQESVDAQQLLSQTAAETGDASIFAGVADGRMMRKATLTGGAMIGGLQSNPSRDENKGDVELGTMTRGGPGDDPRQSQLLDNDSLVVPTSASYWQREMDYLGAKGYVDESKSLKLLIDNAVKYAGKIDKGATASKVEKMLDKERDDQLKSNAANSGIQKEWNRQSNDDLNAPQAAIAPPTMSSLVDSSNVLLDDDEDDEDVLKGIVGNTRKASAAIPDPGEHGAPPNPVPPPASGERPKREDIGPPRESTHLDL